MKKNNKLQIFLIILILGIIVLGCKPKEKSDSSNQKKPLNSIEKSSRWVTVNLKMRDEPTLKGKKLV